MGWDLSCPDWEERIREGRSLLPALPLHEEAARRGVAVFNRLRLPDVPDKPTFGEAGGEWFRQLVAVVHGSCDPATLERQIREFTVLVPKKNSKTTNAAALLLSVALISPRPRAEFLFVGPTQAIADLAFSQAEGMCEADEGLRERVYIQRHLRTITVKRTGAKLKVKSFDTKVLTGVKPVGVLIDELHELASDAAAARLIGQLRGGIVANPEGFLVFITTQSDRPPAGVFRAELQKARAIRDGRLTGATMLPLLYEFPPSMMRDGSWEDPANWWMVTPNRGRSIKIERLVEEYAVAKATGEEERRRWASQHLNVEIGLALQSDRWAGADLWERAVYREGDRPRAAA